MTNNKAKKKRLIDISLSFIFKFAKRTGLDEMVSSDPATKLSC